MVKTEEKLEKEVVDLYLFANLMYGDVLDNISKKTIGFEEERFLEHINKSVKISVESYFADLKIDEKLFIEFNEKQRKHLVNLSKSIDKVKENAIEDIIEEIFTPQGNDETVVERERSLEIETEKIINFINDSIKSINRQIGYCMVLYSYENKGYKTYRLKPGEAACEECKERGRHTYLIEKLKDAEFLPLVHPNCRCTVEIIDDKNKVVSAIDSKAIEEQLGKTESTKEMSFLDYVSALLSAAALIPGVDSIVDLISIPVDLLRGDLISAGFDLMGIVPFIGEVGDAGKALRIADKAKVSKIADEVNDAIKLSTRSKLLSKVQNPKLRNAINEIYRDGATIGDGGLADAIRHELKTGELVGGKSHIQKGKERIKNLENILNKQDLSNTEKEIAEELIENISLALGGK